MKDKQSSSDQNIHDLWARGKFWEIFGFNSDDFTALELAKKYSALRKVYKDSPEEAEIIENAFAVLNAPLTRQFYVGCRTVMQRIRERIGASSFEEGEKQIWRDLWGWVSKRWQVPTDEVVGALESRYAHGAVAEVTGTGLDEESLGTGDIDSVMAAEAFAREIRCQGCGRFDHTLRAVAFPYVISIVVASFKRFDESGIFCHRCRCAKSIKWAIVSLLFGWWSIWGFFWNIGALIDNFRGGKMPRENNEPLVARLAWAHMALGRIAEAKALLRDLLRYGASEETLHLKQEMDRKYPRVSPAKSGGFRLGFVMIVVAMLAMYGFAGNALFGDSSETSTTQPPPIQPDDSFVKWDDSSGWTTQSTITITGSVKNTHQEWSITSVRIEVEMLDKYSKVIQRVTVTVSPSTIPPGGTGKYYQVITAAPACESGNTVIHWVWTPPR